MILQAGLEFASLAASILLQVKRQDALFQTSLSFVRNQAANIVNAIPVIGVPRYKQI